MYMLRFNAFTQGVVVFYRSIVSHSAHTSPVSSTSVKSRPHFGASSLNSFSMFTLFGGDEQNVPFHTNHFFLSICYQCSPSLSYYTTLYLYRCWNIFLLWYPCERWCRRGRLWVHTHFTSCFYSFFSFSFLKIWLINENNVFPWPIL